MDQLGVPETRVGGVKFSDEIVSTIGLTAQHDDVITWLATFHFSPGEDAAENSLLALATAAQQGAGAYVLLATDDTYHESDQVFSGTRGQVASLLVAADSSVYIDPGPADLRDYWPLAVNGSVEGNLGLYSYPQIRWVLGAE